ncbi:MAG: hypothetical protein WB949_01605 [Candidatus Acidiferrales bacterium]
MRLASAAIVGILLAGCSFTASPRQFGPLGPVSQIDVWIHQRDGSSDIFKISDPKDIATIVTFVDRRSGSWETPWYGIPVPIIEAKLFDGTKPVASFGVGKDFFACQRDGVFVSRPATGAEIQEFLKWIDVDEESFKRLTP